MIIFKLFFEHDMLLEQVSSPGQRNKVTGSTSIEDFMKPVPTYSRFYLTATDLGRKQYGLTLMPRFQDAMLSMQVALDAKFFLRSDGKKSNDLWELLSDATQNMSIVAVKNDSFVCPLPAISQEMGFRDQVNDLLELLNAGHIAIYLEKAHHGVDLHIYSKSNIYDKLFYVYKSMLNGEFRFFSINAKRSRSERLFYFESWALESPPHGFEEVFKDTKI